MQQKQQQQQQQWRQQRVQPAQGRVRRRRRAVNLVSVAVSLVIGLAALVVAAATRSWYEEDFELVVEGIGGGFELTTTSAVAWPFGVKFYGSRLLTMKLFGSCPSGVSSGACHQLLITQAGLVAGGALALVAAMLVYGASRHGPRDEGRKRYQRMGGVAAVLGGALQLASLIAFVVFAVDNVDTLLRENGVSLGENSGSNGNIKWSAYFYIASISFTLLGGLQVLCCRAQARPMRPLAAQGAGAGGAYSQAPSHA